MRSLSPDEAALWARVAETIRPLSRDRPVALKVSRSRAETRTEPPAPRALPKRPTPPPTPKSGPGTTLDGTWDRKLRSGTAPIDRRLDLHGFSLDSAWFEIDRVLEQAIDSGDRLLLLITGHARKGEPPVQRGKIRAAVHDWLAASRHASRIAAVRNAHPRHGGGGGLYVILRRG